MLWKSSLGLSRLHLGLYPTRACCSKGEAFAVHCHPKGESRCLQRPHADSWGFAGTALLSVPAYCSSMMSYMKLHGRSHCKESADVLVAENGGASVSSKLRHGANAWMCCNINRARLVPLADCCREEAPILSVRSQHSLCTLRAGATGHCSFSGRPFFNEKVRYATRLLSNLVAQGQTSLPAFRCCAQ